MMYLCQSPMKLYYRTGMMFMVEDLPTREDMKSTKNFLTSSSMRTKWRISSLLSAWLRDSVSAKKNLNMRSAMEITKDTVKEHGDSCRFSIVLQRTSLKKRDSVVRSFTVSLTTTMSSANFSADYPLLNKKPRVYCEAFILSKYFKHFFLSSPKALLDFLRLDYLGYHPNLQPRLQGYLTKICGSYGL